LQRVQQQRDYLEYMWLERNVICYWAATNNPSASDGKQTGVGGFCSQRGQLPRMCTKVQRHETSWPRGDSQLQRALDALSPAPLRAPHARRWSDTDTAPISSSEVVHATAPHLVHSNRSRSPTAALCSIAPSRPCLWCAQVGTLAPYPNNPHYPRTAVGDARSSRGDAQHAPATASSRGRREARVLSCPLPE
jgi:hypothetical protein